MKYSSIEICAGGGGQALGLEQAGFKHNVLVEIEPLACETLKYNKPDWNVLQGDLRKFSAKRYVGIDLLAGGVPCPPFSVAGRQLGHLDDRDLFPEALRLIKECNPKAIMLENVKAILDNKFTAYRTGIIAELEAAGYSCTWQFVNAADYGVSQLRPRAVLVAMKHKYFKYFKWPAKSAKAPPTVGELLYDEMNSGGWERARVWKQQANKIAPTLVGGSKKHGGADLGPTRAKKAWADLGVNGHGLADAPPVNGFSEMPKLTLKMTALIQGFPSNWVFIGKKTPAYRQVGNAFPPPVAQSIGIAIKNAFLQYEKQSSKRKRLQGETA